jgi:hypothetical protein
VESREAKLHSHGPEIVWLLWANEPLLSDETEISGVESRDLPVCTGREPGHPKWLGTTIRHM